MSTRIWFSTTQAAVHVDRHRDTVMKACESGQLHGAQRKPKGRWLIHVDCLNAWAGAQPCEHQQTAGAA